MVIADIILAIIYMMDKNKVIEKVYKDPWGFGSIKNTLKDARKIDSAITLQDVIKWKENSIERKTQLMGFNSFIAHKPFEEFQIDSFFMPEPDQNYNVAMLLVGIFTKYTEVIPPFKIKRKEAYYLVWWKVSTKWEASLSLYILMMNLLYHQRILNNFFKWTTHKIFINTNTCCNSWKTDKNY